MSELGRRMELLSRVALYPVISGPEFSAGRGYLDVMGKVLDGGAKMVQLRAKGETDREVVRLAEAARELTSRFGALLIVDDRVDIALAVGADGVHLGQEDMPLAKARMLGPELILGASSHSLEEALGAQEEGASYVNIGPIYPTATKGGLPRFLGPEAIEQIAPSLEIPFTVMGGIKLSNLEEVLRCGARHVALVTAVTAAPDPARAVREFEERIVAWTSPHLRG